MKEIVFLHKESGELLLKTNQTSGSCIHFYVLMYNFRYIVEWSDDDFINLGEL